MLFLLIKSSNIFVTRDKIIEAEPATGNTVTFKEITALTDLQYDTAMNGLLSDADATTAAYYATTAAASAATAGTAKYVLFCKRRSLCR